MRAVFGGTMLAALLALAVLQLTPDYNNETEPVEDLSWSNAYDDGSGVLGGQQHGVTRVIQTCDADDPGCSFRVSPISYAAGHWRSSEPMKNPALTLQVRQDMKKPSSFEDDIGDGDGSGLSRTDTVGNVVQWVPREKTPGPAGERKYYRLNPPPQEYANTAEEDAQDADAEAQSDIVPKRIVQPLSKSTASRGTDFMGEDESGAPAGTVETDWPGTKGEYPFVGAPKGFPKARGEAGDSENANEDGDEVDANEGGDEDGDAAEDGAAAERATGPGAPALLKNLQAVILKADESKTQYSELQRKLDALNRVAARLSRTTAEAKARYADLVSKESLILNNLQAVDAKTADAQPVEQVKSQPSGAAGAETAAV